MYVVSSDILCDYYLNIVWFRFGYNEGVFQENIPIEEVFENLKCTAEGLSSDAVQERLELFGYNKLEEKKVCDNTAYQFL